MLYLYYGNAVLPTSRMQPPCGTRITRVWHLPEASGDFADSTSHANTGTDLVSATGKTGQIGSGQQFDGSDDRIDLTSLLDPAAGNFTLSTWVQFSTLPTVKASAEVFLSQADGTGTGRTLLFGAAADDTLATYIRGATDSSTVIAAEDTWYHVTLVKTGASDLSWYVAGQWQTDFTASVSSADGIWKLGSNKNGNENLEGYLDEVRISNTDRTAGWIATEYTNQNCRTRFQPQRPADRHADPHRVPMRTPRPAARRSAAILNTVGAGRRRQPARCGGWRSRPRPATAHGSIRPTGVTWANFGTVSGSQRPAADLDHAGALHARRPERRNGHVQLRAWDQTSGTAGNEGRHHRLTAARRPSPAPPTRST